MVKFEEGQQLRKVYDGTVVTIKNVRSDHVVLDGDFEPNHVVMKDKLLSYYQVIR